MVMAILKGCENQVLLSEFTYSVNISLYTRQGQIQDFLYRRGEGRRYQKEVLQVHHKIEVELLARSPLPLQTQHWQPCCGLTCMHAWAAMQLVLVLGDLFESSELGPALVHKSTSLHPLGKLMPPIIGPAPINKHLNSEGGGENLKLFSNTIRPVIFCFKIGHFISHFNKFCWGANLFHLI